MTAIVQLRADRSLIRARGASVRYLVASVSAPNAPPRAKRLPVNVALVLDRSGSMQGDSKFPLTVIAVEQSLALLTADDRFALVVFDERIDVLIPSSRATAAAKKRALRALRQIGPRGNTDLCAGWMHGCEQLAGHLDDGTISRVLLLTDGQANHGETNHEMLTHHAAELHRRGIVTSCFGVGADFDERLLRDIAAEGGGNSYFVQHAGQIPDLVTSELGEALEVVVPRATVTLAAPRGVKATVLNRMRSRKANGRTGFAVELGDLVSGQQLDVVIRLEFPLGEVDETLSVAAALAGEAPVHADFTYASHSANDDQPRDRSVDRAVARLYAGLARAEATEANRHGDFDRARKALIGTSRRISEYANDDPELLAEAAVLRDEVAKYAEDTMAPMELKAAFFVAESAARGRTWEGKARRG